MICSTLVHDGGMRCPAHQRKVWSKYADAPQRITGRRLQKMRESLFAREPLCRLCMQQGHTTLATIRDHIVPLAEGGTDDDENIQPICADCDDVKSKAERLRGRGLALPTPAAAGGRGGQISTTPAPETERFGGFSCAQVLGIF
jgi:5-methylcytosine-specific restriction protein A